MPFLLFAASDHVVQTTLNFKPRPPRHDAGFLSGRSHRIQVDVAHQCRQVSIRLAEDCFIPPLKQMAHLTILSVVILAVGSQQPMHHAAARVVPHLGQQMNMIRHQAIRMNVKGQFRFLALEQAQKLEMVIGRLEYPLAIIPTRDQVVKPTSYFDSRLPCHGGPRIFRRLAKCQYFKPDPSWKVSHSRM